MSVLENKFDEPRNKHVLKDVLQKDRLFVLQKVRSEIVVDVCGYFREFLSVCKKFRTAILLILALTVAKVILLTPYDGPISDYFSAIAKEPWEGVAHSLRRWGDFRDTVTVTLLIFISGCVFRRRNWRRLAVAFFLSASLSGFSVNLLRLTTGRPRPYVQNVEDRWYGPVMLYPRRWIPADAKIFAFQSFPSGHSGTSVGAAAMLMIACPPIGIPMAVSAGGIGWSSLYANKHYLTDVTVGTMIGLVFGSVGGLAYRRMRFTDDDTPEGS